MTISFLPPTVLIKWHFSTEKSTATNCLAAPPAGIHHTLPNLYHSYVSPWQITVLAFSALRLLNSEVLKAEAAIAALTNFQGPLGLSKSSFWTLVTLIPCIFYSWPLYSSCLRQGIPVQCDFFPFLWTCLLVLPLHKHVYFPTSGKEYLFGLIPFKDCWSLLQTSHWLNLVSRHYPSKTAEISRVSNAFYRAWRNKQQTLLTHQSHILKPSFLNAVGQDPWVSLSTPTKKAATLGMLHPHCPSDSVSCPLCSIQHNGHGSSLPPAPWHLQCPWALPGVDVCCPVLLPQGRGKGQPPVMRGAGKAAKHFNKWCCSIAKCCQI